MFFFSCACFTSTYASSQSPGWFMTESPPLSAIPLTQPSKSFSRPASPCPKSVKKPLTWDFVNTAVFTSIP